MAVDRGYSLGAAGLALVSGGLVGAAAALLLAPWSGRKSRELLRGYARRAEQNVHGLADNAMELMDQMLDLGLDQAVGKGRGTSRRKETRHRGGQGRLTRSPSSGSVSGYLAKRSGLAI